MVDMRLMSGLCYLVKKDPFDLNRLQRICVVVLLLLGQAAPIRALAQTAPAVPTSPGGRPAPSLPPGSAAGSRGDLRGRTVEQVRVLGNTTVSTPVILNLVRTREGDKFDPATVEEDYQRIYGLKKFSNVEAKVEPTDTGGVVVIFVVTEQKQIRSIAYRGNVEIDTPTIESTVDVKPGEAIDRFRLAVAKQAIQGLYKERNFPFAHVDIDQNVLAQRG